MSRLHSTRGPRPAAARRRKRVNVRLWLSLGAVLAALVAAATLSIVPGATGAPSVPLAKVLTDPFGDGLGYHASAERHQPRHDAGGCGGREPRRSRWSGCRQLDDRGDRAGRPHLRRRCLGYRLRGQRRRRQELEGRRAAADDAGRCGEHVRRAAEPGQRHGYRLRPQARRLAREHARPLPRRQRPGRLRQPRHRRLHKGRHRLEPADLHPHHPAGKRLAGQELAHVRQLADEQGLRQLLRGVRQQRKRQPAPDAGHPRRRTDLVAGAEHEHQPRDRGQREHRRRPERDDARGPSESGRHERQGDERHQPRHDAGGCGGRGRALRRSTPRRSQPPPPRATRTSRWQASPASSPARRST